MIDLKEQLQTEMVERELSFSDIEMNAIMTFAKDIARQVLEMAAERASLELSDNNKAVMVDEQSILSLIKEVK